MNTTNEQKHPPGEPEPVRELIQAFLDLYPPREAPDEVVRDIRELLRLGLLPRAYLPADDEPDERLARLRKAVSDSYGVTLEAAERMQVLPLIDLALDRHDREAIREALLACVERPG